MPAGGSGDRKRPARAREGLDELRKRVTSEVSGARTVLSELVADVSRMRGENQALALERDRWRRQAMELDIVRIERGALEARLEEALRSRQELLARCRAQEDKLQGLVQRCRAMEDELALRRGDQETAALEISLLEEQVLELKAMLELPDLEERTSE